jgi:uncharacterized protein (TIRG00374 family)
MSSAFKRFFQLALFLGGLTAFFFSLRYAGFDRLGIVLPAVSGPGLAILLIYPFMCAWDVVGWQALFQDEVRGRAKFSVLYFIRLAGEALNNMTPFVDIGGEFLKVSLVASRCGITKTAAVVPVVMARTVLFYSEILFWAVGLALASGFFAPDHAWAWALYVTIAISVFLGGMLAWSQRRGFFSSSSGWLRCFEGSRPLLEKLHVPFQEADRQIASFYKERFGAFGVSIVLHFIGWVAGGLEIYWVMRLMGTPVSPAQAVLVEALFQLVKTASFFIPGNLGAQEAGLALAAQWMGYHPSVGVALSLYKRFRQAVWTAVGFAVWGGFKLLPVKSAPARYNPSS